MSRRPATVTQADVARIIRAAKQAGASSVEVQADGETTIILPGQYDANSLLHGYIYFIECEGFIKIGFSIDKDMRLKALQAANPFELKIMALTNGTLPDERALHKRFGADRVRGEWFRKSPELLAYIETLKAKP